MGKLNGCTSPMSGKENMAPAHSSSNSTVVYIEHGVDGDKKGRDMKLPCTWDSNGGSVSVLRMVDVALRSVVVAFLVVGLCSMLTSTQHSQVTVLGLSFPVSLKWTRSQPFMFLVVVEAMVSGYAAAQFVYQSVVLARKAAPSRGRMSFQLAADQVCTYLVLAAAAAAAGASRTNKMGFQNLGVHNINIPGVCTVLDKFCNHAIIAIIFTFLAGGASAISAALDIYLLTFTC